MKHILLIVGLILMTLFAIWFTGRNRPVTVTAVQFHKEKKVGTASQLQSEGRARAARQSSPERMPLIEMKEEPYVVDEVALSNSNENPAYRKVGGAGNGRVIDQEGKVLMDSGKEIGIFDAVVGPARKQVLVEGAEGKNLILTPGTGERLVLPLRPPGANMFTFSWHWIGEDILLGESGVERLGPDGKTTKSEDNVAESKLYVYDLNTQQLSEVGLPDKFTHAVFGIMEVIPDGHVHLALEGSEYRSWCKITTP